MSKVNQKDLEKHGVIVTDKKTELPIDVLKSLYIMSSNTPEELARRYKLPIRRVEALIRDGDWDKLREENRKAGLQTLESESVDLIEDLLDAQKKIMQLHILKLRERIADATQHLTERGNLKAFDVNSGAEIVDSFGQAVYIKLPGNKKDLAEIKELVEVTGGLLKILRGVQEQSEDTNEESEVEIDANSLLEYSKNEDK
jgi:hypothetical protein